jgi:hypothetical protein
MTTRYIVLTNTGCSLSEAYVGAAKTRETAEMVARRIEGAEVHETTTEGILKILAELRREAEYVETLRTGLGRRARGTQ